MRLAIAVGAVLALMGCGSATDPVVPVAVSVSASSVPSSSPPAVWKYAVHTNIVGTYFYGGEPQSADNNFQTNEETAWCGKWSHCFGGVDDPKHRQHGNAWPAKFKPKENPFYVALPCSDYDTKGLNAGFMKFAKQVPWVTLNPDGTPAISDGISVLKNRWVKIVAGDKTVYAQWEDTGPFENPTDNDCGYVFGSDAVRPANEFGLHAGIDLSPATLYALGAPIGAGEITVSWCFVDETDVPSGTWSEITTTSGPYWP